MDKVTIETMSTNRNLFEEKGEPKRYRTEVLPLTNLTPYRFSFFHWWQADIVRSCVAVGYDFKLWLCLGPSNSDASTTDDRYSVGPCYLMCALLLSSLSHRYSEFVRHPDKSSSSVGSKIRTLCYLHLYSLCFSVVYKRISHHNYYLDTVCHLSLVNRGTGSTGTSSWAATVDVRPWPPTECHWGTFI